MNNVTVNDYIDNIEVDKTKIINSLKSYDSTITLNEESTFPEIIEVLQQLKNIKEAGTYLWDYFNKDVSNKTNITDYVAGSLLIKKYPLFDISNFEGYTNSTQDLCLDEFFAYTELQEGPELINNKVTSIKGLYSHCAELLLTQPINMPNVVNCYDTFWVTPKLQTVKRITTGKVKDAAGMFAGCESAKFIDIGGMDFTENANVLSMFSSVPTNCQIIVKNEDVYNFLSARDTSHTFTIKDLEGIQLNVDNIINKYYDNSIQASVYYEGGKPGQKDSTYSITGNATIDDTGLITLTESAQAGDIITVTATSTYNPEFTSSKNIEVLDQEKYIAVNLGEYYTETEELINNNKVYSTNRCQKIASIDFRGYTKFVVYIKNKASNYYKSWYYMALSPLNTMFTGNDGGAVLKSSSVDNDTWTKYEYIIEDSSQLNKIYLKFAPSQNDSGSSSTYFGYFYIAEEECA